MMFDVAVIGAGPGGYVSAIRAAQHGLQVAIIEAAQAGGTCLNRGCIPTKALLHCAEAYEELKSLKRLGITIQEATYDYGGMAKFKDTVVKKLTSGVSGLLQGNGVTVIQGHGALQDAHTILVNGEKLYARNIILATGSMPSLPPIEGIETPGVINSDQVLAQNTLPESAVIVGGGVIGLEFATLFLALGKKVAIVEMLPTILTGMDEDIVKAMHQSLQKKGARIYTSAQVKRLSPAEGGVCCTFVQDGEGKDASGEVCIVAAGRRPNTEGLGLEALGIEMDRRFIKVDACRRTSISNIYAIGDVSGGIQLAHVASAEGMTAADHIAGKAASMDNPLVPSCVYTKPEIACVGLTEKAAKEQGYEIKIGRFSVQGNGRASSMNERDGFCKLVVDAATDRILGAHLMGPNVTEMIAGVTAAMNGSMTAEQLGETIFPHPTVSEIIMEACHDAGGHCIHGVISTRN